MIVITSTLERSTNSSDATSAMPRSSAWDRGGGVFDGMGSPLETARLEGRPDAVDKGRTARKVQASGHDGHDLLHVHQVLRIPRPGAVLHLVPDAEAVHVVGGDLGRGPVLVT